MEKYLISCPQFQKMLQGQKGEMSVLLFITSPFRHNWVYIHEGDCWKAAQDGGWLQMETPCD